MHLSDSGVRLSATDLAHFLSCRHLTALDLGVAQGRRGAPHGRKDDPLLDLIIQRGNEHEAAYVRSLAASGSRVVDLNVYRQQPAQALAETLAAIRDGAEVVVQAALKHESWFGYADILRRIPQGSTLGDWSYEVIDTKLARETRAGTILQLGLYSAMLATVQGTTPEHFHVVVPGADGTGHVEHSYRVDDFAAYFRLIQREMLDGVASGDEQLAAAHYPEPVEFCEICRWWRHCDHRRRTDDHLSLVANLGRIHRRELESHDYPTLTTLAGMPIPVPFRPKRGSRETYERAREQALVQLVSRDRTTPVHTLRPLEVPRAGGKPVEPRGLARLPAPSPGDVFLDLEGDPFADEGGREYLFGITTVDAPGKPDYHEWWAFTPQEERAAFESVMDFIMDRLARHPDMHVYHYAHYEPSAFKRVMGRYATREEELDRLLRGRRFIDLLAVVRQSMWVGVESYSIKRLEPLYDYTRDVNLPDASSALRRMEYALQLRNPALVTNEDRATIRGYNRDDCVSTLFLRDWLERVRAGAVSGGWQIDRPPIEPDEPTKKITERDVAVQDLRGRLLHDVPGDGNVLNGEARARWLLAYLLDYHRREDKATWWEYYRLREIPEEDLFDERKAIAAMEFVAR
ncbi:MAG TPA: TM0106 family RecB-like putative nuclease, partial [Gemmatimonadaceae bacterium]